MADYVELLMRAVSNLPRGGTPATRKAIYDRGRKALLEQLRSLLPPLPESDIIREETALNAAIAEVEGRFRPSQPPVPRSTVQPPTARNPSTVAKAVPVVPLTSNLASLSALPVSGGIFICYRRADSAAWAGRIHDRLTNRFGREQVFIDVDDIEPGLDFAQILSDRVGRCDALVAIIGKNWLTIREGYFRRRLDNPNDYVRIEIEAALTRGIRVIPVLVDGAGMPRGEALPNGLKALVRRNRVEISHVRFDSDCERLTKALAFGPRVTP